MERRRGEIPAAFSPLERVRVLLVFKGAGEGAVLNFDQDLVPRLPGMERHTLMFILTRLMHELCVLPGNFAPNTGKPSMFFLTPHGLSAADGELRELVESSEIARRLLVGLGHEVPEPVVVDSADAAPGAQVADLTVSRRRRRRPGRDGDCL